MTSDPDDAYIYIWNLHDLLVSSAEQIYSVFHVHCVEEHGGRVQVRDIEMKVTGVYGGDATKRQVAEAVTIQHA